MRGGVKAPRPCHRDQKAGAVDYFKTKGWAQKLAALNLPIGVPVEFWVMDEVRFGSHTIAKQCWGLKGVRVVKRFQQRFDFDFQSAWESRHQILEAAKRKRFRWTADPTEKLAA